MLASIQLILFHGTRVMAISLSILQCRINAKLSEAVLRTLQIHRFHYLAPYPSLQTLVFRAKFEPLSVSLQASIRFLEDLLPKTL